MRDAVLEALSGYWIGSGHLSDDFLEQVVFSSVSLWVNVMPTLQERNEV